MFLTYANTSAVAVNGDGASDVRHPFMVTCPAVTYRDAWEGAHKRYFGYNDPGGIAITQYLKVRAVAMNTCLRGPARHEGVHAERGPRHRLDMVSYMAPMLFSRRRPIGPGRSHFGIVRLALAAVKAFIVSATAAQDAFGAGWRILVVA